MLNNSHNICFYLVEGVSAFVNGELISGILGKTLILTWTVLKCHWCYVDLYFHSQHGSIKSRLFFAARDNTFKFEFAKKKFGDRINVTWVGKNFEVELKHLQSNDTGNFSVLYRRSFPTSILFTEVQGMYRFISEFIFYEIASLGPL